MTTDVLTTPDGALVSGIAGVWCELLGLDAVGPDADFFELGGSSLDAVRMLFALEEGLAIQVSFSDFLEAPTVRALAAVVAGGRSQTRAPACTPTAATAQRQPPRERLSFAQERLWFLEQLGGSTAAYNMPVGARLRGALDVQALELALREVVSRHEALRTTFAIEGKHVAPAVAPVADVELEQIDLRGQADPEAETQRLLTEFVSRPFDLERGPLVRAALVRLADDEHVLELAFHHIVCDGCSQSVIMRELGIVYGAARAGEPAPLVPPRTQYGELAGAQRAAIEAQGLEDVVAPWLERLQDAPHALELPTDRPRPAVPSYDGATHRVRLPAATVAALRRFAMSRKTTPYATLLAAFYMLLHRHSGQEDIVVGATTAGREQPELDDGVGLFAHTVALRSDLSGRPSFEELVARVRETVLWAIAHERAPLQEIVARLGLERDLSRHPLFQVFCAQVPVAALALDGAEPYDALPATSRFDLTLFIEEEPGEELELAWEYSTDLFDVATIECLADRYLRLLDAALADPRRSIEALPLLDDSEREQAIAAGSASGRQYPVRCMHEAFERHVAKAPDSIAVSFEGESLTYAQLDARANRLAHRLIELGVGPETLVALFFEPSLELMVGVLGVLKAGGAYLPLDPEHPRERIELVLADAGSGVLVTEQPLLERLGEIEARTVCLDRDAAVLQRLSPQSPGAGAKPENLAYVIYTSGSTGRPKGVEIEHRQVARLFSATESWFDFGPGDVWTLLHSYAFDFSVWEMWGALAHGGRLVIPPVWTIRSPHALTALLAGQGVTVLNATPSLFAATQDELLENSCELRLRLIVFGGEALRPPALRPWFSRYGDGGPALVNMYGITETTVHVTYRPISAADGERETSPVGVPIPDLSVYVLDRDGSPVPSGVAGELYVGGAGVARGYRNRPELSAQRFVANPFGPGRLYRTGDVAARLADGQLEFRGRVDDQVKVRGFRIELGEIESAIREHAGVSDCAAVAIETALGDTRLAVYVVASDAKQGEAALREQLMSHLERRLPAYMLPAAVVLLERIPLTRNGKMDRRALPVPRWQTDPAAGFVEPRTPTEVAVAQVWREVLACERVGADDNFFNLGGHSLLAARVTGQVRKLFAVDISVRALFERPGLREFAAALDDARATNGQAADGQAADVASAAAGEPQLPQEPRIADVKPTASGDAGAYPLSFPQQQLLFFDQLTPGSVTYNAALAWRVQGPLDVDALRGALIEVFERHEALRTVFAWGEQDAPNQRILECCDVELPVVDISRLAAQERGGELERQLIERARRPFDLSRDPMLRTTLFRLGPEDHAILLAPHHIAFDAWAVEVLYRELGELYAASVEGRQARLPELALQYRDFARWQRQRLQGGLLEGELGFWRAQLGGAPTLTRLPLDRPRAAEQTFAGATHRFVLGRDLTQAVRATCAATEVTPYMLLLAAFATLLYRAGGQDDILLGGPMANRQLAGIEHLIGFFANTVIVRTRLDGNPTFAELLTRVRDSVLASYEHQQTPLELVIDAVRPEREPGVHPLFQVNFRVRVGDVPGLRLARAKTRPLTLDLGLARFELAFELHVLDERIEAELNYNVALFDQATIERLAADFESVLRTVATQPDVRLLSLQLASERDAPADGAGAIGRFRRGGGSRSEGRLS